MMEEEKKLNYNALFLIFVLGMLSFASVFFIQVPIQNLISNNNKIMLILPDLLKAILFALVAGIVQELFKFLPSLAIKEKVLGGMLSGLGFGIAEVILVLMSISKQVGLSNISYVAIIERISAVVFHISSTGLVAWGFSKKKFFPVFVFIVLIHATIDTFAILTNWGKFSILWTELIAGFMAIFLAVLLLYIKKRSL